ncbi:vacuolar-processing enzyme-like [Chenopodium quinoa]|uniref:vacuolar-processing enzyme-like n=1 Tax=Chenopodium quinoa TaxID=63459 RepID=UPI000B7798A7|nr:vacuolar-processing enzyme-like [Chenopodium quinoa]
MGCQGFSGYLLKPRNFLITLAIVAVLVLGIYNQVTPDYGLAAAINKLLQNLPIKPRGKILDKQFVEAEKRIFNSHLIKYGNSPKLALDQQEASLHSLVLMVLNAPDGALKKKVAQKELDKELANRRHVDCAIEQIAKAISFPNDFSKLIDTISRVDDWDCYSTLLSTYETYCGGFSFYGIIYENVFANMCNNGTQEAQLAEIASEVCGDGGKCQKVVAK